MYLGIQYESVNVATIPGEIQYYRKLSDDLTYENFNTHIRDNILSINPNPGKKVTIPAFTRETYKVFLDTLDSNPELVRSLFSARRYNGSNAKK